MMKNNAGSMKRAANVPLAVAVVLTMGALCPSQALAQVPGRFYWKTLSGANAVPLIELTMTGTAFASDRVSQ